MGSNSPLHFLAIASSAQDVPGKRLEPKTCERCSRQFFRPVPEGVKAGVKLCARCGKREVNVVQ
jgi:hypothetical protein